LTFVLTYIDNLSNVQLNVNSGMCHL